MNTIQDQLNRMEATLLAVLEVTNPIISFGEVRAILRYKSRDATRKWLRDHKIERVDRGYRRALVIAAATERKA